MKSEDIRVDRYDRQIRLWDLSGQRQLYNSKVLVLGSGLLGSEVLKNLVLTGIGEFLIVDSSIVTSNDVATNYFVARDDVGKSLAETIARNVCQLNPSVIGQGMHCDVFEYINQEKNTFSGYDLVLSCNFDMITVEKVGVKCTKRRIPLINCQTNGFFGFSKSFIPEHCVIESHSEEIDDLRICDPFAELSEYVDSVDLSALDEMEHSHVPYLVLLIKFIAEWKSKNGGNIPQTFKQKKEFAAQIKEAKGTFDRQNYEEAENNVLRLITEYKIPEHIVEILNMADAVNLADTQTKIYNKVFWILVKALKMFLENQDEGSRKLPLVGTLPDMFSDTKRYVEIQKVYKEKARVDAKAVYSYVLKILANMNQTEKAEHAEELAISFEQAEVFCKNCRNISVINANKFEVDPKVIAVIKEHENNRHTEQFGADQTDLHYEDQSDEEDAIDKLGIGEMAAVALQGALLFKSIYHRYPGEVKQDKNVLLKDRQRFRAIFDCLLIQSFSGLVSSDEYINMESLITTLNEKKAYAQVFNEFVRSGGAQVHSIAAVMGGLVAQEAIKLTTHHYIPETKQIIYNGVQSIFHFV